MKAASSLSIFSILVIYANSETIKDSSKENDGAQRMVDLASLFSGMQGGAESANGPSGYGFPSSNCPSRIESSSQPKCRKLPPKQKQAGCETIQCVYNPTTGFTLPPSYLEFYDLGKEYLVYFSKRITHFGSPAGGLQYGQPMSNFGQQYNPFLQQTQPMNPLYQGMSQYGQMTNPYGMQQQYNPFNPTQNQPYAPQQVQQPTEQYLPSSQETQYNPYAQNPAGNQIGTYQYPPYQQGQMYNQGQTTFGTTPQWPAEEVAQTAVVDQPTEQGSNTGTGTEWWLTVDQPTKPSQRMLNTAKPSARQFQQPTLGGQQTFPNYNTLAMPSQMLGSSGGNSRIAVLCKHPHRVCRCESPEDCNCRGERPKVCTQRYQEQQGYFWVQEWVPYRPQTYQNPAYAQGANLGGSPQQDTAARQSAPFNQYPNYLGGRYEYRMQLLWYKKPSGCACQFIKVSKTTTKMPQKKWGG